MTEGKDNAVGNINILGKCVNKLLKITCILQNNNKILTIYNARPL